MTDSGPDTAAGLKAWALDGVRWARVRLELLGIEAREHTTDALVLMLTSLAALALLCLGLVFFSVLVTVLLWDSHRTLVLALFTALFFTLGGVAVFMARGAWRRSRQWFAASLGELRQDEERLKP